MNPQLNANNWNATTGFDANPNAPAQQSQGPNFLERMLPTAGGILGGLVAAPLDAFTLGGASIGGAGIGSALGKAAENALSGQKVLQGDVLTSGLEGSAGQLGGNLLSGLIGHAGGMLGDLGGNMAEGRAAQGAAEEGLNEATAIKNAYADVPKGLRQAYGAADHVNFVKGLGLDATDPNNLVSVANGANDVLGSNLSGVLSNSGPVDLSDYNQIVKDAIGSRSNVLGSYDPIAVSKGRLGPANNPATSLLRNLEQLGQGTARTEADPMAVRELTQKVGAAMADAKPGISATTGAIDPVQKANYDTLSEVYGALKDRLYNRSTVDEGITALQGNIRPEDVGGNQALADHLNEVLSNAKSGQDVLSEMSRFTNMNKLGNAAVKAQSDVASPATVARAKELLMPGSASSPVSNGIDLASGVGAATGHPAALAGAIVNHVAQSEAAPAAVQKLGDVLTRIAPLAKPAAVTVATSPNAVPQGPQGAGNIQAPLMMNQGVGANPMQQGNIFTSQSPQAMPLAMQALAGMFDPNLLSTFAPAAAAASQNIQKAQTAQALLPELAQQFNQAGGAQGPIAGTLTKLGSMFTGGPASQYGPAADSLAKQLSAATGINITPDMLPQITQNQTSAQDAMQRIQSLLTSLGAGVSTPSASAIPVGS